MEKRTREYLQVTKQDSDRVTGLSIPQQPPEAFHSFYEDFTLRGIRVDRFHPGFVSCSFTVPPRLTDRNGNMAVGAIANLVDEIGATMVYEKDVPMNVSIDMSISYLSTAKLNDELEISAKLLGGKRAFNGTLVLLKNKATGEVIAEGRHSLFYILPTYMELEHVIVSQNGTNTSQPTVATTNTFPVAFGPTGYYSPYVPTFGSVTSYMPAKHFGGPPSFYYPHVHPQYSAQQLHPAHQFSTQVIGLAHQAQPMDTSGQTTVLPHAFATGTLHDPTTGYAVLSPVRKILSTGQKSNMPYHGSDETSGSKVKASVYTMAMNSFSKSDETSGSDVKASFVSIDVDMTYSSKSDNSLEFLKARLVVKDRTQLEGVDVDENFSPFIKLATIRTVLSLATSRHWPVHQLDVKNAFLHDLGSLNYFLAISVTRDSSWMFLSQRKYADEILEWAGMVSCNFSRTPVDTESKLGDDGDSVSDLTLYQSLTGSLHYLTFTHPDISYALFTSSTTDLVAYSDADWAGCPTTRRSTLEAEYRGVANAIVETCWLRNLLRELHTPLSSATLVYCDNVCVLHVPSRYQFIDIFTKGLLQHCLRCSGLV
nr:thioesterase superfamily [Tanacetum cinerariifolium]